MLIRNFFFFAIISGVVRYFRFPICKQTYPVNFNERAFCNNVHFNIGFTVGIEAVKYQMRFYGGKSRIKTFTAN